MDYLDWELRRQLAALGALLPGGGKMRDPEEERRGPERAGAAEAGTGRTAGGVPEEETAGPGDPESWEAVRGAGADRSSRETGGDSGESFGGTWLPEEERGLPGRGTPEGVPAPAREAEGEAKTLRLPGLREVQAGAPGRDRMKKIPPESGAGRLRRHSAGASSGAGRRAASGGAGSGTAGRRSSGRRRTRRRCPGRCSGTPGAMTADSPYIDGRAGPGAGGRRDGACG